jgi:ribose transport system substrate-binding protein
MKDLNVFVSLITHENDYQREQAAAAESTARNLGINVKIAYANNSAIDQSQQILQAIQSTAGRPDAILVEPVGTGMVKVAEAAASVGVGWGILNRDVEYLADIRRKYRDVPVFVVATDQEEVGKIQARQFAAILKNGGCVLYLEGPGTGAVAPLRSAGMLASKPVHLDVKVIKGDWTEESAYKAITSWLCLSIAKQLHVGVVGCQNDAMAVGARRAFQSVDDPAERSKWLALPFTGCDGLPGTGQAWVRKGMLAATVVTPPNTGLALEILAKSVQTGTRPEERTFISPSSFPSIEELAHRFER